jgi:hypothetical protein
VRKRRPVGARASVARRLAATAGRAAGVGTAAAAGTAVKSGVGIAATLRERGRKNQQRASQASALKAKARNTEWAGEVSKLEREINRKLTYTETLGVLRYHEQENGREIGEEALKSAVKRLRRAEGRTALGSKRRIDPKRRAKLT